MAKKDVKVSEKGLVVQRWVVVPERKIVRVFTNKGVAVLQGDEYKSDGWTEADIIAAASAKLQ